MGIGMNSLPDRVSRFIELISGGVPAVIITLLFLLSAFLINTRPFGLAQLRDITGGATIPDMQFFSGPAALAATLDALGPAGREFYLTRILPLDMLFPLLYMLFFMVVLSRLMGILGILKTRWSYLLLIPAFAGSADYGENFCFLTLLLNYPDPVTGVAAVASLLTAVKWICIPICFLLILIMALGCLKKRLFQSVQR